MKSTNRNLATSPIARLIAITVIGFSLAKLPAQTSVPFAPPASRAVHPPGTRVLAETGPNYRIWQSPAKSPSATTSTTSTGAGVNGRSRRAPVTTHPQQAHGVVEIATGMNYWDGQQWTPSNPIFDISPDGSAFIANQVQHRVKLAGNINTIGGAITLVTPDGIVLKSTPVAIALYDSASGRSGIIAGITNSTGVLAADGKQVVYENAFDSICADVVVSLDRGSFEQDVVITGRIDPSDYGFPTNTTRIQVITEFYDAPVPDEVTHPIYVEQNASVRQRLADPDVMDKLIGWGEFGLATGQAFVAGTAPDNGSAVPVAKDFRQIGGRTFLIESAVYGPLAKSFSSLPDCRPAGASLGPRKDLWRLALANPTIPEANQSPSGAAMAKLASTVVKRSTGVIIDYIGTLGGNITSNVVFRGDTTYFVSGAVYCNASVTIEGGAVFKYPKTTAFLQINSSPTCATSAYRPAIFTAGDDESIGDSVQGVWAAWTGTVDTNTCYANPALLINYASAQLTNLRFSYCKDAIKLYVPIGDLPSVSDCQLVSCIKGIHIAGLGSGSGSGGSGVLVANNTLFGFVAYPVTTDYVTLMNGTFTECTFDNCQNLLTCTGQGGGNWYFYNSILSHVTNLLSGSGAALSGAYNGIYKSPTLGAYAILEDQNQPSAFAASFDSQNNIYLANGQGRYYLRPYSPFVNAGSAAYVSAALKADLAQRTTSAPPDPLTNDLTSSQTFSQQPIRDNDAPDLGYHYPAVDYIINGMTINNCTLNIDQGTVLAYMGSYYNNFNYWGIRVNTGGRLIVNGVPTNRVVFARLEAVQESPYFYFRPKGPTVTLEGVHFSYTIATPMPEAKVRYADFPAISTPTDNSLYDGYWPASFGPMDLPSWGEYYQDWYYGDVANLEFNGCLFQGGGFYYISGHSMPRTFSLANNVFERCDIYFEDWALGNTAEQFTAVNNLFYGNRMGLAPVSTAAWTFTDNLFDHVQWVTNNNTQQVYNGPVTMNHHNGYVGMSGNHLSPSTDQITTDKDLAGMTYQTGALGRFYLPPTSPFVHAGSRSAAIAGLYHFTSLTSNAKESTYRVSIGQHYVALVNGGPADSNAGGPDGIPDFIADANGDGVNGADELPWSNANSGVPSVVSPANGAQVSGIVAFRVNPGTGSAALTSLTLYVDGNAISFAPPVDSGSPTLSPLELDSRLLANGQHTVLVAGEVPNAAGNVQNDATIFKSAPITINCLNTMTYKDWYNRADTRVGVQMSVPSSSTAYVLYFLNHDFPKSYDPYPVGSASVPATSGTIAFSQTPANLGYASGSVDPAIFSFTAAPDGTVNVNPLVFQDTPWASSPGAWVTTYADDPVEFYINPNELCLDPEILPGSNTRWWHDGMLWNWYGCGGVQTAPEGPNSLVAFPALGQPQTWPLRTKSGPNGTLGVVGYADLRHLKTFLADPRVRNFYGYGHGMNHRFINLDASDYKTAVEPKRFRFVFMDGCSTAYDATFFKAFGAQDREVNKPMTLLQIMNKYPNQPLQGPLFLADYEGGTVNCPIRPSAFMGWHYHTYCGHSKFAQQKRDPVTKQLCWWDKYAAMAHWEMRLLTRWMYGGETLLSAAAGAVTDAAEEGSVPPWDIAPYVGKDENGQAVYFHVETCLEFCGYGELRFNDYNRPGDAW